MALSAEEGARKLLELLDRDDQKKAPDFHRSSTRSNAPVVRRHQIIGIATDEELRERAALIKKAEEQAARKAPKHSANYKGPRKVVCPCGEVFEVPRSYGADTKKYCSADCRKKYGGKKTSYKFSAEVDDKIRTAYADAVGMSRRAALKSLSQELGLPAWAIRRRALVLDVTVGQLFPKGRKPSAWADEEKKIVTENAAFSFEIISRKLREAGYARSKCAIKIFIGRQLGRKPKAGYSATSLARRLGIDAHAVTRWIRQKLLKAEAGATARKPQQGGDVYVIEPADVREFIIRYVALIDFRKVDKFWLVEFLTDREIEVVN